MTDPLVIILDPNSAEPPFEQLRLQVSEQARSGALPVGHKLPTVRGLAQRLGLAANTVAKAYRALESDGVIETRGRNGTFVAAAGDAADREAAAAAQSYARRVRRLGLDRTAALGAVQDALRVSTLDIDEIVYERNKGGRAVESVIRSAWSRAVRTGATDRPHR